MRQPTQNSRFSNASVPHTLRGKPYLIPIPNSDAHPLTDTSHRISDAMGPQSNLEEDTANMLSEPLPLVVCWLIWIGLAILSWTGFVTVLSWFGK